MGRNGPRRDRVVSLRLTDEEHAELAAIAERVGVDMSELIRRAALALTYPPAIGETTISSTTASPLVRLRITNFSAPAA